jgi:hypothetical protein
MAPDSDALGGGDYFVDDAARVASRQALSTGAVRTVETTSTLLALQPDRPPRR